MIAFIIAYPWRKAVHRFEVFSQTGDTRWWGCGHEVCPAIPFGESWGLNHRDHCPDEAIAAVKKAFPDAHSFEWSGLMLLATLPSVATAERALEVAVKERQAAIDRVQAAVDAARADLDALTAPRLVTM